MLTAVTAHAGVPLQPHDLWSAWTVDPLVVAGLAAIAVAFARGHRTGQPPRTGARARAWCVAAAIAAIAVALLSPLDAASASLASAHMLQHIVLILIAAPLVALGAPGGAIVRGAPAIVRWTLGRWRRPLRSIRTASRMPGAPVAAWLVHVGTLWFWHASVPYDAAVRNDAVHAVEHLTLTVTAIFFWRAVLPPVGTSRVRNDPVGILLVFAMGLQSVFLSALLTFATKPWYGVYAETVEAWGLTRLEDQQIAGAIMWVPASLFYVGAGLALVVAWMRWSERSAVRLAASPDSSEQARLSGDSSPLPQP